MKMAMSKLLDDLFALQQKIRVYEHLEVVLDDFLGSDVDDGLALEVIIQYGGTDIPVNVSVVVMEEVLSELNQAAETLRKQLAKLEKTNILTEQPKRRAPARKKAAKKKNDG